MFYPCTGFQHIRHAKNSHPPKKRKSDPFFPTSSGGRTKPHLVLPFPAARLASQWRRRRPPAHDLLFDRLDFQLLRRWIVVETIQLSFGLSLNTIPLVITHTIPYLCKIIYLHLDIHGQKDQRYMDAMC